MASCVEVTTDGFLTVSELPISECSSFVISTIDEYKMNAFEFNPSEISGIFFFAFGLVLISYKAAWVVGVIKNVIAKI